MTDKQRRKEVKRRARNKARRADYNRRKNARGKREQVGGFRNIWRENGARTSRLMQGVMLEAWLRGAA